jgi:hypothetical protein
VRPAYASVLAAAAWACSAPRGAAPLPGAPTAARATFFPEGTDLHWHIEPAPEVAQPERPLVTDADRAEFDLVARECRAGVHGARDHCPAAPSKQRTACFLVCLEALEAAFRASGDPPPLPVRTPVAQGPAPPPFRAPDPLARALRACVADVVESGAKTAVCHFDRPLDEMVFGQRHCDELCARATGLPSPY